MQKHVAEVIDSRQFPQWGKYLEGIGWEAITIDDVQIFIKKVPLINRSTIKIQHPYTKIPFAKVEQLAKRKRALMMFIEPHLTYYPEEFPENGYKKSTTHLAHSATVKIDLSQNEKDLFNSFSENAQRNIKKAQKHNLRIEHVYLKDDTEGKYFAQFLELFRNLSKMKKIFDPGDKDFFAKRDAFKDSSFLSFAYEQGSDTPIAVVWYGFYKDVVVYLQTGITQKGYDLLANYLLVWEGMREAKRLKMTVLDFESIYDKRYPRESKRWIGYSEFKKRFHGEIVEYPQVWVKYYSKPIALLYWFANLFSK